MHDNRTAEIISILDNKLIDNINIEQSFKYACYVNSLIYQNKPEGYKIVINVLNNWSKIPKQTQDIWTDIIEISGFYPYLEKNNKNLILKNLPAKLRKELHLSSNLNAKYFHEEQLKALNIFEKGKNLILSAPTSFGKSLLIEEIVASNRYRNIVIIQPTLALLDESRQKLFKYSDKYKILIRTSQEPSQEKGNIFLFTAERVNEYQYFSHVDFLIIDEFYKLSGKRDDERSAFLNNAFYHLYNKFHPKFYFLGPNIDGISEGFAERYNAEFYKTDYSLVDNRVINVFELHRGKFGLKGEKKEYKENVLFELLLTLGDEQTIIYCSSPARVRYLAQKFTLFLKAIIGSPKNTDLPLIEWIEKNVSEKWNLIDNLKYSIGIHDGALPKHITSSIIDYFNTEELKYIFCSSTIIEGVNTNAKNIIYFDDRKGGKLIDYFDYSNIKGRAGRMMIHYVGNIYNFNPPPDKKNYIIDIPFYQQNPIKDETLIQLSDTDIIDKNTEQYRNINKLPLIDREIIKANGVSVLGQAKILSILRTKFDEIYHLINWTKFPKYEQLTYVLSLAWDHLIVDGETIAPMNRKWLVKLVFDYGYNQNQKEIILNRYNYKKENNNNNDENILLNEAIQEIFQIVKHWIQYKVPKWLAVINSLQELVCNEYKKTCGNYSHYAYSLENDFLPDNLTILLEYGIPVSAIRELEKYIPENVSQDNILSHIQKNNLHLKKGLLKYEQNKINKQLIQLKIIDSDNKSRKI